MTKWELYDILDALDNLIKQEKQCCETFCKLNPYGAPPQERRRISEHYRDAVNDAKFKIKDICKID